MAFYRLHLRKAYQVVFRFYLKGTVRAADITYSANIRACCILFINLFSYLGTKLCRAVGRTQWLCSNGIFSSSGAPTGCKKARVLLRLVWKRLQVVWCGCHLTRLWIRDVVTGCSNCRRLQDWGGASRGITFHTKRRITWVASETFTHKGLFAWEATVW
jgi:hypothetical protein